MADCLDDGEFWLPPKFLADDDLFIGNHSFSPKGCTDPFAACPFEHPFGSDLGSPVDSSFGSTETESDEDDLTDLSRKMTRSTLDVGFKNPDYGYGNSKVRFPSGSPQSTLRPATWDLLCEAATEVAKMRLTEELYGRGGTRGVLNAPERHPPVSVSGKAVNSDSLLYAQSSVPYHQLLDFKIQLFKRQQMMKMKQQLQQRPDSRFRVPSPKPSTGAYHASKSCAAAGKIDFHGRTLGLSASAWPSLQQVAQHQQNGSGMRAVFLGAPAIKRECAGTGVFLPRRAESQPEPRKKPDFKSQPLYRFPLIESSPSIITAYSTALVPPRVVQALNLNMEGMASQPQPHLPHHRFNGGDVALNLRRNGVQARSIPSQPKPSVEIRLPHEWTY